MLHSRKRLMKADARTMSTYLLNPESNCDQNHISVVRRYLDRHHLNFILQLKLLSLKFLLKIHFIKLFNFVFCSKYSHFKKDYLLDSSKIVGSKCSVN